MARPPGGRLTRLSLALLAIAVVAGTGLRVAAAVEKRGLTHDEAISYLAATCHQGEWAAITLEQRPPFGETVAATEWKRLLRPGDELCFGTIASDLGRHDIHPPLYFWLLHLAAITVGLEPWTGLGLNILLSLLTVWALFHLARRVLERSDAAALVAGTWFAGPASGLVFTEARQYELLALISVLTVWQAIRYADAPTRAPLRELSLLAALCAAGALTHFYFAFVALACAGLLAARLRRAPRALLVRGVATLAAGYALFALLHPHFHLSFGRARAQSADFDLAGVGERADAVAASVAAYLVPPDIAGGGIGVAAFAALVVATVWLMLRRRLAPGVRMVSVFAWLAGVNAILYLAFLSPASAMDPRHLSAVWPFCAFVPVVAICAAPSRLQRPLAAILAAVLLGSGAATLLRSAAGAPAPVLATSDGVVVDNVARGILPPVIWQLDDDATVLAADQRWLLAHESEWLPVSGARPALVSDLPVSDPRYGNSDERSEMVRALAASRYELVPSGAGSFGIGRVYELRPREPGTTP